MLHGVGNGVVGLELGIGLNLWKQAAKGCVYLLAHRVAVLVVDVHAAAQGGHRLHHVFVEVDGAVYQAHHVLQYLHALLKVVVDVGGLGLDALFELLEVVAGLDFHEDEDHAWQHAHQAPHDAHLERVGHVLSKECHAQEHQHGDGDPQRNFKHGCARAHSHGQLLVDDMDVAAVAVYRACEFVKLICHNGYSFSQNNSV